MSFYFSEKSLKKLYKCHPLLVELMLNAIRSSESDFTIVCGYRSNQEQNDIFSGGRSSNKEPTKRHTFLKGGLSKHNKIPSEAVDIIPYPFLGYDKIEMFEKLGFIIKYNADILGIDIVWGGDWKMLDYGHFELKRGK